MRNRPTEEQLNRIPDLYKTEKIPPGNKIIHLHFFFGSSDWYVAEYDGENLFFGFVILNNDMDNAEWGYFSFTELDEFKFNGMEIECESCWEPGKASEADKIRQCGPGR